jgi:hypothetical protein
MPNSSLNPGRRRILIGAAVVLALAIAAAVLLLKMTPEVYTRTAPMGADEAAVLRFNQEVVNKVGNVYLDRSGRTPLALEITEEMVNAIIAQSLADEEEAGKALPPALMDMRVGFEPGLLVVATRLGDGLSSVVVSQSLRLSATEDGLLLVKAAGTAGGLLPLPGGLMNFVRRALADQAARHEAAGTGPSTTLGAGDKTLDVWRAVVEALDGKPVPLGKGKKRIVLDSVEIERGTLRITGHRAGKPANPPADVSAALIAS